jgi:SAM-dependent methyltransferase
MKNIWVPVIRYFHPPIYGWRLQSLVRQIAPHLQRGDRVLDVGCGSGMLGRAIMDSPISPPGVKVSGLERIRRDMAFSTIEYYDGRRIPYGDNTFDVVLLMDVLHHETDPHRLIDECARVARRLLIIKDHVRNGFLSHLRISLMDWASNAPYGIPCLYRYNRIQEWRLWYEQHGLSIEHELNSMKLYPGLMNFVFGGRIQHFAVIHANGSKTIQ